MYDRMCKEKHNKANKTQTKDRVYSRKRDDIPGQLNTIIQGD